MSIKLLNIVSWGGNPLGPIVDQALKELDLKTSFVLIESDNLFAEYGISKTPAMIIDDRIVLHGPPYSLSDIKKILLDNIK